MLNKTINQIEDKIRLFPSLNKSNQIKSIIWLTPGPNQDEKPKLYIVKQKRWLQRLIPHKNIYAVNFHSLMLIAKNRAVKCFTKPYISNDA